MNYVCSKCKEYGLRYDRKYAPSDFLEGKRNSLIWIVSLNPKGKLGVNDGRDVAELENYFGRDIIHPFFRDFRKVSERLFDLLGKERGGAHTDIVKCFSPEFPPKNCKGRDAWLIVNNCKGYLEEQIRQYHPRIIICNGSWVCRTMKDIVKLQTDYATSYIGIFNGSEIVVILSGFVGRIDNCAKLRLGKEIESYMERYGIGHGVL